MKVTDIKVYLVNVYRANWVFVKVLTDGGLHGVGEATLEYREKTVAEAILELKRELVGKDPHNIEKFYADAYRDAYWRGGPVLMSALAGVEMALWDIKGKAFGVPVYQLLGGKCRDRVTCYANAWFSPARTPDEFAVKARQAVAMGYRGLKWDPFGSAWQQIAKHEMQQARECIRAVVEAVGDDVDILIEAHGRFNIPSAVKVSQMLEEFDVLWLEEPIPPDNKEGLADVRRRSRVPIAAGERMYGRYDYRECFRLGCVDYAQPDVSHMGIAELRKIGAMAECHHIPICPHNPSGPIANAATLQLAACMPNFAFLETMIYDVPYRRELTTEEVDIVDGAMLIPEKPGLGLDINEDALAEHPYKPVALRHYAGTLTEIRPADATGIATN
ncbi:MAG: galactonate dehydratase [Capsulimonadaceae bacterium]|nr:galactonate dehydratase [Capsulimonadaceae bacterium]